jgi:hypothetical protein
VCPRKRFHQRGFAMIHMTSGTYNMHFF